MALKMGAKIAAKLAKHLQKIGFGPKKKQGKNRRKLAATQESANFLLFFPYFSQVAESYFSVLLFFALFCLAQKWLSARPPGLQAQRELNRACFVALVERLVHGSANGGFHRGSRFPAKQASK